MTMDARARELRSPAVLPQQRRARQAGGVSLRGRTDWTARAGKGRTLANCLAAPLRSVRAFTRVGAVEKVLRASHLGRARAIGCIRQVPAERIHAAINADLQNLRLRG